MDFFYLTPYDGWLICSNKELLLQKKNDRLTDILFYSKRCYAMITTKTQQNCINQ